MSYPMMHTTRAPIRFDQAAEAAWGFVRSTSIRIHSAEDGICSVSKFLPPHGLELDIETGGFSLPFLDYAGRSPRSSVLPKTGKLWPCKKPSGFHWAFLYEKCGVLTDKHGSSSKARVDCRHEMSICCGWCFAVHSLEDCSAVPSVLPDLGHFRF